MGTETGDKTEEERKKRKICCSLWQERGIKLGFLFIIVICIIYLFGKEGADSFKRRQVSKTLEGYKDQIVIVPSNKERFTSGSRENAMRNYVEQIEYAHRWYNERMKEFQSRYPIGSVYSFYEKQRCGFGTNPDLPERTIYIRSWREQKEAFDKEYRTTYFGSESWDMNGPMTRALWGSRHYAISNGYLPDNVASGVVSGTFDAGRFEDVQVLLHEDGISSKSLRGTYHLNIFPIETVWAHWEGKDWRTVEKYKDLLDTGRYLQEEQNASLAEKYQIPYSVSNWFLGKRIKDNLKVCDI